MRSMGAICSAILIVIMLQVTLSLLMKTYELDLLQYKRFIVSKSVLYMSVGTVIMVVFLHFMKWNVYSTPEMILNTVMLWGLAVLTITDYKKQILPNKFLLALLVLWIVIAGVYCLTDIQNGFALAIQCILGAAISGIVFFVCYFLSKRQLGAGDVKLSILMGLYLGGQRALNAFLYGTMICCIYSLIQVARKKLGWKDGVPLVPFLTIGTWIILLIFSD